MTASIHKLTAGCGYDYLTRQVAAHDTTEKGHATLASYYSERGETPGSWYGRGLVGLGDLGVGDEVTQEQMQALFAHGYHPNMKARLAGSPAGASKEMIEQATLLGQPFKTFEAATAFRLEVEQRNTQWRDSQGLAATAPVPVEVRAEIVNQVAAQRFQERIGRAPTPEELGAEVVRWSRSPTTACAGYDVTFTPVKSVSALWAVAPKPIAALIEQAHDAAVDDALRYVEDHALYSRAGRNGVRQIDVHGLIAACFKHRDSRAGDPNLHTHVAIANKVQAVGDGKWRSIDGRLIFKALVSVSETYNTQLEAHLYRLLGIEFAQRPGSGRDRRAVREIVGVPARLRELWSSRRAVIEVRQAELAAEFQTRHGRPPTPAEAIRLAQQATLETRQVKHSPRTLDEQRATWRREAEHLLGPQGIQTMLIFIFGRTPQPAPVSPEMLDRVAAEVVQQVAQTRSTWQVWHLRAEASRRARELTSTSAEAMSQLLVERALNMSIPLNDHDDGIVEPAELRRADGTSMYEVAGSRLFTSQTVIDAETQILAAAARTGGRVVPVEVVEIALLEAVANGTTLNTGQANLVRTLAVSGNRVQLALAAAGTGKTTAMRVLARAWEESGGTVLGLAPSAAAAAVLGEEIGNATTVAKLLWDLTNGDHHAVDAVVNESTLILVDEAGMTDTLSLARLISYATSRGASIRLVGDDRQLAAVGAGGVLRDIHRTQGAVVLDEVLRFTNHGEKLASLALRDGDPAALGWYLDHDRIHPGSHETAIEGALTTWLTDTQAGRDSLMLAGTRGDVADLNRRAQQHLLPPRPPGELTALADGNTAGIGDLVLTRRNDRRLRISATDWVKNGDRWTIQHITPSGGLGVMHRTSGLRITLPAQYVAEHVELGYATTIHTAQGITVDTTHTIITGTESRQQLYVAATRGRTENHLWVPVVGAGDEHTAFTPSTLRPPTAVDIIETVLARDTTARSVTTELTQGTTAVALLPDAVNRYHDALTIALEHHHATTLRELDAHADDVVPGLTHSDAWPTLRQRLLHTTHTPLDELRRIAAGHAWDHIRDPAALLAAIVEEPRGGPLPWLPPIPQALQRDPHWGLYLQARATRVTDLATQVRAEARNAPMPSWMPIKDDIPDTLIADLRGWRTAMAIDPADQRPTGPPLPPGTARRYQEALDAQLIPQTPTYGVVQLRRLGQGLDHDPTTPLLARDLAALEGRRLPVHDLLATALNQGPLPAQRPAAALRWRIQQLADNHPLFEPQADRWKQWAATVNPDLTTSPHWPTIQGLLTSLQDRIDLDKAGEALRNRTPQEIRAVLFRVGTALTKPTPPRSRALRLQQQHRDRTTPRRQEAPRR